MHRPSRPYRCIVPQIAPTRKNVTAVRVCPSLCASRITSAVTRPPCSASAAPRARTLSAGRQLEGLIKDLMRDKAALAGAGAAGGGRGRGGRGRGWGGGRGEEDMDSAGGVPVTRFIVRESARAAAIRPIAI